MLVWLIDTLSRRYDISILKSGHTVLNYDGFIMSCVMLYNLPHTPRLVVQMAYGTPSDLVCNHQDKLFFISVKIEYGKDL